MDLLLDAGADVNVRNDEDSTPLFVAAQEGRLGAVEILIDYGADINCPVICKKESWL